MEKKKINLILSSSSKNRIFLLKKIKVPFTVFEPSINEDFYPSESPIKLVNRLSLQKGIKAKEKYKNACIISADTVVYSRKKIIDKTASINEARLNLKLLSGRRHRVFTSVTFFTNSNKYFQYICQSIVKFKLLDEKDIDNYLTTNEWKGCSGSYAIQGYAEAFVDMISGSYSNVVGLPMNITYKILKNNNLL